MATSMIIVIQIMRGLIHQLNVTKDWEQGINTPGAYTLCLRSLISPI